MLEALKKANQQARFIIKNGGEAGHKELNELFQLVAAVYGPIKAKKDASSKKGEAAKLLPELQQQPPVEAGNVETVAADLSADAGEAHDGGQKQAVGE